MSTEPAPEWAVKAARALWPCSFSMKEVVVAETARIIADHAPKETVAKASDEDLAREIMKAFFTLSAFDSITALIAAHTAGLRAERDGLADRVVLFEGKFSKEVTVCDSLRTALLNQQQAHATDFNTIENLRTALSETQERVKELERTVGDTQWRLNQILTSDEIGAVPYLNTKNGELIIAVVAANKDLTAARSRIAELEGERKDVRKCDEINNGLHAELATAQARIETAESLIKRYAEAGAEEAIAYMRTPLAERDNWRVADQQDKARLDWLESAASGNIGIDHSYWAEHMPDAGKLIISLYEMGPDCDEQGDQIARADNLRAALDDAMRASVEGK